MISQTAEYALRAAIYLANQNRKLVGRIEIAKATRVPAEYLLKVLNALDARGIVESKRGPNGGYRLTREPGDISVLDVVEVVSAVQRIKHCPLGLADHIRLCPLHKLLDDAAEKIEHAFRQVTIGELAATTRNTKSCSFPQLAK